MNNDNIILGWVIVAWVVVVVSFCGWRIFCEISKYEMTKDKIKPY